MFGLNRFSFPSSLCFVPCILCFDFCSGSTENKQGRRWHSQVSFQFITFVFYLYQHFSKPFLQWHQRECNDTIITRLYGFLTCLKLFKYSSSELTWPKKHDWSKWLRTAEVHVYLKERGHEACWTLLGQ